MGAATPKTKRSALRAIDRRTVRTRRLLRDALMDLALEKGYDGITVEEITERADLGRTTFYLHYRDKDELFLESIEATANELMHQVQLMDGNQGIPGAPSTPFELAFRHAAENSTLYRILLKSDAAAKALARLRTFISNSARDYLPALAYYGQMPREMSQGKPVQSPPIPPQVLHQVSDYFASSLLGMLTWWLEEGMPHPPDEMAAFFLRIFIGGAKEVFRVSEHDPQPEKPALT